MKVFSIIVPVIVFFVVGGSSTELNCKEGTPNIKKEEIQTMVDPCIKEMRSQIQREINASLQYLAMGAHFSKDTINRPGFAKMFFESASEEREHAMKLISYLLMRGELVSSVSNLIKTSISVPTTHWNNGIAALRGALELEAQVTDNIRTVIKTCEDPRTSPKADAKTLNFNDYHLVDYLTGEFLEEQYKGQRDLAGKISELNKLMGKHGELGEFLFDKKLF